MTDKNTCDRTREGSPREGNLSREDLEAFAEAERLARRLPAPLLRDVLALLVALVDRPGSATLKVEKAENGKVFSRAHGNEIGYS